MPPRDFASGRNPCGGNNNSKCILTAISRCIKLQGRRSINDAESSKTVKLTRISCNLMEIWCIKRIVDLGNFIEAESSNTKVTISNLLLRIDDPALNSKAKQVNYILMTGKLSLILILLVNT